MTRYPSRQATCGRPGAYDVRIVTSMPACPHSDATVDACTSEPPASGSSRSRQASMLIRRRPARAARSPSLSMTSSGSTSERSCTASRSSITGGTNRQVYGGSASGEVRYAAPSTSRASLPCPVGACVKLTGERPMQGATPDSLLALHDAGYREVITRLGPGVVVDVGCGVGDETARLVDTGRTVIGVDYDAATAIDAGRQLGRTGPDGALRFAAMDGSRIGLRTGSVDYVCSSHIIEHFLNPERHVADVARVLAADGAAFFLTPN